MHVSPSAKVFFSVKHEESETASTLNFMPSGSFGEFGFYI